MKLKGLHFANVAEIQEAVTDGLKKVQKEEFSAAFQKLYDSAKAYIYIYIYIYIYVCVCVCVSGVYFKYIKK
jgi:hypothetical protein